MRIVILALASLLIMDAAPANAATTRHVYQSGVVASIGNNQITIGDEAYQLRPEVTVVLIVREANGAFYQRKGRLSDVSTGKKVHLKTRGRMVYEIEVER
ncbi:hypothetical protein [Trichlorobacter ammonificans]|uniref:Uncharacterized protein n=1 Tax=Trichlorobacter ammonificans TaxID=2916410 RepID=A0ABM9D4Q4_9BACT|nr:hypothetical protein [Trichlorobacter ammonificans]CAH2030123.1 exported protein of unknown function [Trichlorobacter ammonificans]